MLILSRAMLKSILPLNGPAPTMTVFALGAAETYLAKAVIKTPHTPDGKVDWESIPSYASVWVTIGDESSPLYGRPILLTKLPDGRMAVTGGAGFKHWGEGGKEGLRARKHLAITTGKVHGTAADIAREQERQEIVAHNTPLRARLRELQQTARRNRKAAQKKFRTAVGVDEPVDKEKLRDLRARLVEHATTNLGMDKKTAEAFSVEVTRQLRRGTGNIQSLLAYRRAMAALEVHRFEGEEYDAGNIGQAMHREALQRELTGQVSLTWDWQSAAQEVAGAAQKAKEEGRELTTQEVQHLVAKAGEQVFQHAFEQYQEHGLDTTQWEQIEGLTASATWEGQEAEAGPAPVEAGLSPEQPFGAPMGEAQPLAGQPAEVGAQAEEAPNTTATVEVAKPLDVRDETALTEAVESFRALAAADTEAKHIRKELLPEDIERVTPQALEQFREDLGGLSDEETANLIRAYEESAATGPAPDRFYTALADHWSDRVAYAEGIGQHATQGAATAIAGLVGTQLGGRADVLRLMEKVGVEGAVMALALEMRKKYAGRQGELVKAKKAIETAAAKGQQESEEQAMRLHEQLRREEAVVRQQVADGELSGVRGDEMLADVLMRQRENLGTALGSLQATAAFVHALDKAMRPGATDELRINFGDDEQAARERFDEMKLGRRGRLHYDANIGWQIITTAHGVRKFMYHQEENNRRNGEWERIKADGSSTEGYRVPLWGDSWTDEAGQEQPYRWRTEQRNDIEWLRKAGSGIITRTTGAGKTNTCLGYYAHLLSENPDFIGHVIVPRGRVDQWLAEVRKFAPELAAKVVAVPEGGRVEDIERMLAGVRPGTIVLCSHREATRHADFLAALNPQAVTVDEPQEMFSRSSRNPKLSAGAKRIMRIKTDHRVALTATPATRAPTDVFDLANWAFPGELGHRSRFERAYGGFGYGTNAQDEAVQSLLWREVSPFLSGDRMTPPSFQVESETVSVKRTAWQRKAMLEMEAGADTWIAKRKEEMLSGYSESDKAPYGSRWRQVLGKKAGQAARAEYQERMRDVLRAGRDPNDVGTYRTGDTARLTAFREQLTRAGEGKRHVVWVDSAAQRRAVMQTLEEHGLGRGAVRNIAVETTQGIAPGDVEKRKREFQAGQAQVIVIDRGSSAGHNLQAGDVLHVLGTPQDAATWLQTQGRIAREPRKGNVRILTYRHEDSPFDFADWAALDTQVKVLRATAPGLFTQPSKGEGTSPLRRSLAVFAVEQAGRRLMGRMLEASWNIREQRPVVRLKPEVARCLV